MSELLRSQQSNNQKLISFILVDESLDSLGQA